MLLLAQTTTTTSGTDANPYEIAFVNIAIQIFDIIVSSFLVIMQQVLTGFFSFILP